MSEKLLIRSLGKASAVDTKNRTVTFSFASINPVRRWFGDEILSHEAGAMVTTRLDAGVVPMLLNHNWDKQIGKVISYDQNSKKTIATAKISRSKEADDILQEMADEIRTEISVGYKVHKMQRVYTKDENKEGDADRYLALSWEPGEVSSVSMPADISVGIGRAEDFECDYRETEFIDENGRPLSIRGVSEKSIRQIQGEVLADYIRKQVLDDYVMRSDLEKAAEAKGFTREVMEMAFHRVRLYNESPELALLTVLAERQ